jgi:hypothetical protein
MYTSSLLVLIGLAASVTPASFGNSLQSPRGDRVGRSLGSRGDRYGGRYQEVDSRPTVKSKASQSELLNARVPGKHCHEWECCKPKDPCKHEPIWIYKEQEDKEPEYEEPEYEEPEYEEPEYEEPKPEPKKQEAPKPEPKKQEAPKPAAPKPAAPKPAAPKPAAPKPEAPKPEAPKPEKVEPEKEFDLIDEEIEEFKIAEELKHDVCKCDKCHDDKFHCHWEYIKCKECQRECHRCDRWGDKHCDHDRCDRCKHDKCRICKCIDHHDKDKVVVCKEEVKVEVQNVTTSCTPRDSVLNFSFSEYINLMNWTSASSNDYKIYEILYTDANFGYPLDNSYESYPNYFSAAFNFALQDSDPIRGLEAHLSQYVEVCPHSDYKFSIQYYWDSCKGSYDGHGCSVTLSLGNCRGKEYPWTDTKDLYPDKWNQIHSNTYHTGNETYTKLDIHVKCSASAYYQASNPLSYLPNKPLSHVDTVHLIPIRHPKVLV